MDEEFLKGLENSVYTPDAFLLDQAPMHLVFECGPVLYDTPFVCTGYTVEKMSLWKQRYNSAIAFREPGMPRSRVQGALYLMTADQLIALDNRRKNGLIFERKKVEILTGQTDKDGDLVKTPRPAWMYKGVREHWVPLIDWDQSFNRNGDRTFELAPIYPDSNHRLLHNHYSFNGIPIESVFGMPEIKTTQASAEIIKMIGARNEIEIRQMHNSLRRVFPRRYERTTELQQRLAHAIALRAMRK